MKYQYQPAKKHHVPMFATGKLAHINEKAAIIVHIIIKCNEIPSNEYFIRARAVFMIVIMN